MYDWSWVIDRDDQVNMHMQHAIPCSCGCGQILHQPEMHHGILSKRMFQGKKGAKAKRLRNNRCNCFMINSFCHQMRAHSTEHYWDLACERYGVEEVRDWYEQCAAIFKSELPNFAQPDLTTSSDMV